MPELIWCEWTAAPVVAVIAWSRIILRDHTVAQTVAGAIVGAVVAGPVFAAVGG